MPYDITYMWNLKQDTNEPIYKTETDSRTQRIDVAAKGECGGRGLDWEFGISRCELVHKECINNKALMYSTGNYIQYPVIKYDGKEYEKNAYICITESLCCTAVITTTL